MTHAVGPANAGPVTTIPPVDGANTTTSPLPTDQGAHRTINLHRDRFDAGSGPPIVAPRTPEGPVQPLRAAPTRGLQPAVSAVPPEPRRGRTQGTNQPDRPVLPTMLQSDEPSVVTTPAPVTNAPLRPAAHFQGPPTFEGPRIKQAVLDSVYGGVKPEKFGTTTVQVWPGGSGKVHNVRDMHYDLGDGKVGMRLIPVKNGDAAASRAMDEHLRKEMGLGPKDPIFSLVAYIEPKEHTGDLKALARTKTEMGHTHLGAYIGEAKTVNAPETHRLRTWSVEGSPANVQVVSMQDTNQATLNKNLLGAMSVLNKGVQFPQDYTNDVFKTADLNTTLQFYRDWIKGEPYLKDDPKWQTYCAEHKTIVLNVGLNVPHNPESFAEIFGAEGPALFEQFKTRFQEANGRPFTAADETRFEPLWKKEGLTPAQIAPLSKAEHDAFTAARFDGSIANGTFTGKQPLPPGLGMAWKPETTADLVHGFVETYSAFKDVGGYAASATVLGFGQEVQERMGLGQQAFLKEALPVVNKLMVAEALARAPGDAAGLSAWTERAAARLYEAFGGKPQDLSPGGTVNAQVMQLARASLQGIGSAAAQVAQAAALPADKRNEMASGWVKSAIQTDLERARKLAVADPSKTELYSPPAITNRIMNGMHEGNAFVKIRVVATAVDASEVE